MPFTVFIDESGEAGISKVRSDTQRGASPYFVLGAAVLQPEGIVAAEQLIKRLLVEFRPKKWNHATDFEHAAKIYLARQLSTLQVRYFAVVSKKSTLGQYKDMIDADPQLFYNKCVEYLLEKVCAYLIRFEVSDKDFSVILESRNHDYGKMIRCLDKVRANPHHRESRHLRVLNPCGITHRSKDEEPLLKIADLVAHSVYQCVNKSESNHFIPEYRYFEELSIRFGADDAGKVLGAGLKPIHSVEELELDKQILKAFTSARAALPQTP